MSSKSIAHHRSRSFDTQGKPPDLSQFQSEDKINPLVVTGGGAGAAAGGVMEDERQFRRHSTVILKNQQEDTNPPPSFSGIFDIDAYELAPKGSKGGVGYTSRSVIANSSDQQYSPPKGGISYSCKSATSSSNAMSFPSSFSPLSGSGKKKKRGGFSGIRFRVEKEKEKEKDKEKDKDLPSSFPGVRLRSEGDFQTLQLEATRTPTFTDDEVLFSGGSDDDDDDDEEEDYLRDGGVGVDGEVTELPSEDLPIEQELLKLRQKMRRQSMYMAKVFEIDQRRGAGGAGEAHPASHFKYVRHESSGHLAMKTMFGKTGWKRCFLQLSDTRFTVTSEVCLVIFLTLANSRSPSSSHSLLVLTSH
jgi:hypothetical protein